VYEPVAEEALDRGTHCVALGIITPVAVTYGAIAYGLYLVADATFPDASSDDGLTQPRNAACSPGA
jgi:hypothetical protein